MEELSPEDVLTCCIVKLKALRTDDSSSPKRGKAKKHQRIRRRERDEVVSLCVESLGKGDRDYIAGVQLQHFLVPFHSRSHHIESLRVSFMETHKMAVLPYQVATFIFGIAANVTYGWILN
jgi:hypothetical protein